MTRLHSTVIVTALFTSALAPAHALAQGGLRDRLAAATEAIEMTAPTTSADFAATSRAAKAACSCACRLTKTN